jgi:hypothetical protein
MPTVRQSQYRQFSRWHFPVASCSAWLGSAVMGACRRFRGNCRNRRRVASVELRAFNFLTQAVGSAPVGRQDQGWLWNASHPATPDQIFFAFVVLLPLDATAPSRTRVTPHPRGRAECALPTYSAPVSGVGRGRVVAARAWRRGSQRTNKQAPPLLLDGDLLAAPRECASPETVRSRFLSLRQSHTSRLLRLTDRPAEWQVSWGFRG